MSGEVTSRPTDGGLSAAPFVPDTRSISRLRAAAAGCEGCPLYVDATQTVFGERAGAAAASRHVVMLVGEQPGNDEDLEGHPFVGPAGRVLWSCVDEAGLAHEQLFVTNAVKHFKHERRGKRRLHRRPDVAEIDACAPWLRAEVARRPARRDRRPRRLGRPVDLRPHDRDRRRPRRAAVL